MELVIIPTLNNSQNNIRNIVRIRILAIWVVNLTISLSNLGVCIEKKKLGRDPHEDDPLRKISAHEIEVDLL